MEGKAMLSGAVSKAHARHSLSTSALPQRMQMHAS